MTQRKMATSGGKMTKVRIGRIPRQDSEGHGCGMREISRALLETLLMLAPQCTISKAYTKVMAMP